MILHPGDVIRVEQVCAWHGTGRKNRWLRVARIRGPSGHPLPSGDTEPDAGCMFVCLTERCGHFGLPEVWVRFGGDGAQRFNFIGRKSAT